MKALIRARLILLLLAAVFICASESAAQQLSLSGTVRDANGVVPGATVTLATGGAQVATTTTDEAGKYRFTGLSAGSFELSVSLRGFETAVRNVALGPETPAVDVLLAVGRVNTTVSVTATAGKATATRLPVPDVDVPAQVSTIPQELILQQGVNTVGDALRNASGVQAIRWYGVYEQYTIRGFFDDDRDSFNAVMIDGMRRNGNRAATQANNVEAIGRHRLRFEAPLVAPYRPRDACLRGDPERSLRVPVDSVNEVVGKPVVRRQGIAAPVPQPE